jgi:hypothetical protein
MPFNIFSDILNQTSSYDLRQGPLHNATQAQMQNYYSQMYNQYNQYNSLGIPTQGYWNEPKQFVKLHDLVWIVNRWNLLDTNKLLKAGIKCEFKSVESNYKQGLTGIVFESEADEAVFCITFTEEG